MYITRFQFRMIVIGFFVLTSWFYMPWVGYAFAGAQEACEVLLAEEKVDVATLDLHCMSLEHNNIVCDHDDEKICLDINAMSKIEGCKPTPTLKKHYCKAKCEEGGRTRTKGYKCS